jgi:UDP-GlcNAc3NAcA epimerase
MIKALAVSRLLRQHKEYQELLIHTGQHYDRQMSDIFFDELGLPSPFANLGVQEKSHGLMIARMLERLEPLVQAQRPDVMLLYGDTNSTLAGALVAVKSGIPIAHVEAGVRTGAWETPEESNRVIADRLSKWAFCATRLNYETLTAEGLGDVSYHVGDVMYDLTLLFKKVTQDRETILDQLNLRHRRYVLATCHRGETTDDRGRLKNVSLALNAIAQELPVILPLHPRTRVKVAEFGLSELLRGVTTIDPVGYLDMQALEAGAAVVVTDSGGVQKEAFFHGVPCVIVNTFAGWPEIVSLGHNLVAGLESERIVNCTLQALRKGRHSPDVNLFGDGHASEKIVSILSGGGI